MFWIKIQQFKDKKGLRLKKSVTYRDIAIIYTNIYLFILCVNLSYEEKDTYMLSFEIKKSKNE